MVSEKWKFFEVNGEIFHFSLFILGKKFHDWYDKFVFYCCFLNWYTQCNKLKQIYICFTLTYCTGSKCSNKKPHDWYFDRLSLFCILSLEEESLDIRDSAWLVNMTYVLTMAAPIRNFVHSARMGRKLELKYIILGIYRVLGCLESSCRLTYII